MKSSSCSLANVSIEFNYHVFYLKKKVSIKDIICKNSDKRYLQGAFEFKKLKYYNYDSTINLYYNNLKKYCFFINSVLIMRNE